jgi:Ca2+-binding RTX toxin-like protein
MCFWDDWNNWDNWDNWNNWDNWANFTPGSIQYNVVTSKTDTTTEQTAIDPTLIAGWTGFEATLQGPGAPGGFQLLGYPAPISITVSVASATADDNLYFDPAGISPFTGFSLTVVGNQIMDGQNAIATITGGTEGTPLVITMNNGTHPHPRSDAAAIIDGIHYLNTSDNPPASRTITIHVDETDAVDTDKEITVNITASNDGPVAVMDLVFTGENDSVTIDVLANDTDVDEGHTFTLVSVKAPDGAGSASIVNNQLVFDPGTDFDHLAAGKSAEVVVEYTMEDENGAQSSSTVKVTVNGSNDGPVAKANSTSVKEDATSKNLWSSVIANDLDVDIGDTKTIVSIDTTGTLGTVKLDTKTKSLVYVADDDKFDLLKTGASIVDHFTYTIKDAEGLTSTATVNVTVAGIAGGKAITGTASADVLVGTAGEDTMSGVGANDTMYGNDGADRMGGGLGNDKMFGGASIDRLSGDAGNDKLDGGAGDDTLTGGTGNDTAVGGTGNDTINGNDGLDQLSGGNGNDALVGGNHNDRLSGDAGNDKLTGDAGNDVLNGGTGNDTASGGVGNDTINGGDGGDQLSGGGGHDSMIGGAGADQLSGDAGNDKLNGGADNDVLEGGTGNDSMVGGGGNDSFVFGLSSGTDSISDFIVGADVLVFEDGVTITDLKEVDTNKDGMSDATVVSLSNLGSITLSSVIGVTDAGDLTS